MDKLRMIKLIKSSDLNNYFVRSNVEEKIIGVPYSIDGAHTAILEDWQHENNITDYVMGYIDESRLLNNLKYKQYSIFKVEELEELNPSIIKEIYNWLY